MYVQIRKEYGRIYLNEHEVMERRNKYVVAGKVFETLGEAAVYVSRRDKLQKPSSLALSAPSIVNTDPEPVTELEQKWISVRDLTKKYEMTQHICKVLRTTWQEKYPSDIKKTAAGSIFRDTPQLHRFILARKSELIGGLPDGCPKNFITLQEAAEKRGLELGTLQAYVKRGEIAGKYLYYSKHSRVKYYIDPNYVWGRHASD